MSIQNNPNVNTAAGALGGPINYVPLLPINAKRAPTVNDTGYAIGQEWIYSAQNQVWFLTSVANGEAHWVEVTQTADAQFVTYTVQTNGNAATGIANFALAPSSGITIYAIVLGDESNYNDGIGGELVETYRRAAAGSAIQVYGASALGGSIGGADVTFGIVGGLITMYVTGVAAEIWNWKVLVLVTTLP